MGISVDDSKQGRSGGGREQQKNLSEMLRFEEERKTGLGPATPKENPTSSPVNVYIVTVVVMPISSVANINKTWPNWQQKTTKLL